jgi:hypothetical protein
VKYTAGEDFPVGVEFEADDDATPEELERCANEAMGKLWNAIDIALDGQRLGHIGLRYDDDMRVLDASGHELVGGDA